MGLSKKYILLHSFSIIIALSIIGYLVDIRWLNSSNIRKLIDSRKLLDKENCSSTSNKINSTSNPSKSSDSVSSGVAIFRRLFSHVDGIHDNLLRNLSDGHELLKVVDNFMTELVPLILAPPKTPINESCSAEINPKNIFQACPSDRERLNSSRKIGILLQFGFDVDTLEIHLNQLWDIVDQFFIVESTRSHFKASKKFLIWERIKDQSRFKRFQDKITHIILDDADSSSTWNTMSKNTDEMSWGMEALQEATRWKSFLQWNDATKMFTDDDFLGFGDTDEIPSRSAVLELKHCDFPINPVDIGIWFPYGNINQAFQTDYPVNGFPFTLGDPTFWKLSTAMKYYRTKNRYEKIPGRGRGKSPAFILGGMHMTHYGYLPFNIIKCLTMSESGGTTIFYSVLNDLWEEFSIRNKSDTEKISTLEKKFAKVPDRLKSRIRQLDSFKEGDSYSIDKIAILPWFYECNKDRYPSWEGKHDTRLD